MKFFSTFETAEIWGISARRILNLIKSGRIPEAKLVGSRWMIPENAKKPSDGRTKAYREEKQQDFYNFRFPIFEFKDMSSFNPPLSNEEQKIKAFTEAYISCRFSAADRILGDLPETAQNKYIRIEALYCVCMLSIVKCDVGRFLDCYGKLKFELQEDFPYKAEMNEYFYEIEAFLGYDEYYADKFQAMPTHCYHESFLPRLCNLSALRIAYAKNAISPAGLTACELNCNFLEKTDNFFDTQALHIYLACAYSTLGRKEECDYHFRRALVLAEKYNMFYTFASMQYYYVAKDINRALEGFSLTLKRKIQKYNNAFQKCHVKFTDAIQINSIYKLLTGDKYPYIVFAVQRLTNKEIAGRLHISVGTVGKHYGEIYAQVGVKSKAELVRLYHNLTGKSEKNRQ